MRQGADDGARALTSEECTSLGQWLVDACEGRPNERSAQVDGWCSNVVRNIHNESWTTGDCVKHIKYMDEVCFRSTSSVHSLMECDRGVARP